MVKVYYPHNFNDVLLEYYEKERKRIKDKYISIYRGKIDKIKEIIEDRFKNDFYNHESHCKALSSILTPFIRQKIENYELLFIEPLLYLRNIKIIPEETPIWDFILVEIVNNKIIRIILGEVKTQKAKTGMTRVEDAIKLYSKKEFMHRIFDYIEELLSKKSIVFDKNTLLIEFVLVVQGLYFEDYEKSVKDRNLKLNIWEIDPDIVRSKYTVKIHRWEKILGIELSNIEEDKIYLKMLSYLKNHPFKDEKLFSFTYASDLNLVLKFLYKSYINMFSYLYLDSNMEQIIKQAGGGNFYDDENTIPDMIIRIKKLFSTYNMFNKREEKNFFKQRIKINNKIIKNRLRKAVEEKIGAEILNQAIKLTNPKKPPKGSNLDKWIKRKNSENKKMGIKKKDPKR